MKKLLILLSLTLSMTAFAAPQGNTEKSAEMEVTARVIAPLTINATPMAFGDIIQGTTATATGTYVITGQPGETFEFTITEITELTSGDNSLAINLAGLDNIPTVIPESGNLTHVLTGTLNPTLTTVAGDYEGTITARIQY
ncbi:MAG: hypothetical protein ACRDAS_13035 [Cetobacterium sp.]